VHPGPAAQLPVKLVGKLVDGFVEVIGCDADYHIRAVNLNVAFGNEVTLVGPVLVVFQLHAESNNTLLVFEKLLHFFVNRRFDGLSEVHIYPTQDDFMIVHSVFLLYGLTT
jgi:hypothetical protein